MAISKDKKNKMVADYVERLSGSQAVVLVDYRGMTVANILELRGRLREAGGQLQVIKNTLYERALEETGVPVPEGWLQGPLAVGYCVGQIPPVAKALIDYARETQVLQVRGAIVGNAFLDAEGVKSLTTLPSREVLLAQLLGTLQGPMGSLASTIMAPMRELVQVLQARSEALAA